MQIFSKSTEDLGRIAETIIEASGKERIIAFFGEMGAGKTTLIKEICKQLNVIDTVLSPTFSIVNEYQTKDGGTVYHFDFYRLKSLTEAYDMGYEEYFYSKNYCFIEWSEKILPLFPSEYLKVEITVSGENERTYNIKQEKQ